MNFKKVFATLSLLVFLGLPLFTLDAKTEGACEISDRVLAILQKGDAYPDCSTTCNYETIDQCGTCCLINTIYNISDWAFLIIMAASVIMIIWGAAEYLGSGGDTTKLGNANKRILAAAGGIVVALLARAVPSIVLSIVA